jgi:hypothetical protein
MDKQGLLLCAKYAVSPNFFGYCGPTKSSNIIDHLRGNIADEELCFILSNFETLYPYLQLIAHQNKINDPFDRRVVEAYWIGNPLLKPVKAIEYQAFSKEKLTLDKKLSKVSLQKSLNNISKKSFLPHHAFHVFNIFRRMGNDFALRKLEAMEQCRIGWGRVAKYQISNIKNIFVKTKQLTVNNKQLSLAKSIVKELKIDYKGKSFIKDLKLEDWVSFHWGYMCDFLTETQVKNLEYYTKKAIEFYNL